jgi:hypothetical protein
VGEAPEPQGATKAQAALQPRGWQSAISAISYQTESAVVGTGTASGSKMDADC